ncbi:hypothetical protein [Rhizobium sp. Root149]|uniref:hypothetical protein n=1 Tax=Rhizobium sp. Root149 TaxID=1736473 RepID=UPI000AB8CAB4|nr:hypothetical protein [Rhizobium sp. Root149]
MGSKSQVRSMQRGSQKRDRTTSKEPDYGKVAPTIRDEDRAHIGLTDAAAEKLATTLTEKIRGYARAGFRKPADVSRLLNKEAIRTAAGTEWNPRLVYFLLDRIFADSPRKPKAPQPTATTLPDQNKFEQARQKARKQRAKEAVTTPKPERPPKTITVRAPSVPVPLTPDEMAARIKALRDHFNA